MNKKRRAEIAAVVADLAGFPSIEGARDRLEDLQREEQEFYDNMPESFQNGDKGEKAQSAADKLQECVDKAQEIIDAFNELDTLLGEIEE